MRQRGLCAVRLAALIGAGMIAQSPIFSGGNRSLQRSFPQPDYVIRVEVISL